METQTYKIEQITINHDKKRKPLSAQQRAGMQGNYRYYGAQSVIDYVNDYLFDGEYLLIAEDGENLKSNKQNIAQIVEGQFWLNNHAHIVQTNDICNIRYLGYWLNAADISGYITGSAQPKLSQGNLNAIEIELPERNIQDKIAYILYTLDKKIETNETINRNLEEQLGALYKENIRDSELPSREIILDELCNIFTGRKNANQNDEDGQYMFFTCGEKSLRINSYIYDGPAIIISGNGSYTGRTLFYNGKFDLYQRTYACTLKEGVEQEYIFGLYAILKIELNKKITGGTRGSSIPYIVMNDLAKFEFNINDDVFMEFSKQSKAILESILHNVSENEQLANLRDSLLPKLMLGELDVSEFEI